jgi:hypothetical protein
MLVHSVYFWLKPDVTPADREAIRRGLETLRGIRQARQMFIGTPAATEERGVIDNTYDLALTVLFDSLADQDAYQVHPLHNDFLAKFASLWKKVIVYDAE